MSSYSCLNQIYRSQTFMGVHFLTGPANNILKISKKLSLVPKKIKLIVNSFYTILIKINVITLKMRNFVNVIKYRTIFM